MSTKSIAHDYFERKTKDARKVFVCSFCHSELCGTTAGIRLEKHILFCGEASDEAKKRVADCRNAKDEHRAHKKRKTQDDASVSLSSRSSVWKQGNISDWISSLKPSDEAMRDFWITMVKLIAKHGSPFRLLEDDLFDKAMQNLCPNFKNTSYRRIQSILKELKKQSDEQARRYVCETELVSLATDGWSTPGNIPLMNFVVVGQPGRTPYLWTAEYLQGIKSSDSISELVDRVIADVGKSKVVAVVSDNHPATLKGIRKACEQNEGTVSYGCAAHILNLLAQDILNAKSGIPLLRRSVESATSVAKMFRGRSILRNEYKKVQDEQKAHGKKEQKLPVLPCGSRWSTTWECLNSLITSRETMQTAATRTRMKYEEKHEKTTNSGEIKAYDALISTLCDGKNFWNGVKYAEKYFHAIWKAISKLESDASYVCDIVPTLSALVLEVEKVQQDPPSVEWCDVAPRFWALYERRMKMFDWSLLTLCYILTPSTWIAHSAIDSLTRDTHEWKLIQKAGDTLEFSSLRDYCTRVLKYDGEKTNDAVTEYMKFTARTSPFSWELFDVNLTKHAHLWWENIGATRAPILSDVAKRIVCIPSTSASSERNWKLFKRQYSKLRSRLLADNACTIVKILSVFNSETPAISHKEESQDHALEEDSVDECDEIEEVVSVDEDSSDGEMEEGELQDISTELDESPHTS
eukprot:TRINITY_DN7280_c0_g1_i1.p1 TRINITY_DN7280_c0_g1~~TRINITY_DN7280_c0_g1_i1.p1  ORF type:complete len:693 (+),score=127.03 TRINITY_DN7280_c0_g1_i1:92-2170(+)